MAGFPFNIHDLIHARTIESNRIEFKATWDQRVKEDCLRTICAFANDVLNLNGGYLVLGIETGQLGEPVLPPRGLDSFDLDLVQREIRGQCQRLDPEYQPVLFPQIYQQKRILVIMAPAGDNRPYQAPRRLESNERAFFIRQGSETIEAKGDPLRQLMERTAKVPFDDRRNQEARVEDISPTLVRRFLADVQSELVTAERVIDDRELYRGLRLTAPLDSQEVPRNVALLFFHEEPERFFKGARIEVVQFADDAGGNLIEERKIGGPLAEQVKNSVEYLNGLSDVLLRKVPGRAEVGRTVAYPYEALEEAIVNAIYHRSYDNTPEPTKIYLYPDRIEIISYPGPVQGIEMEHLQSGRPVPPVPARNRRIGELLKELRLAEGRGTGLPKIRRKMMENGSPDPKFDFDPGRTYFRVTLPVHPRYRVLHALRESAHLWAVGDRSSAMANLRRAYEQQPGSGALAGQIIEYAATIDDLVLAKSILATFEKQTSKSETAQPYLRLAKALLDRDQNTEARAVLKSAPLVSGSSEDALEAAILRKKAGEFQEAHRLLAELYPSMMDDPKVVQEFAQTKLKLAQGLNIQRNRATWRRLLNEAVELLHRAIQLSTDPVRQSWCYLDLARASNWLREPLATAEDAYLKAIALNPNEPRFKEWYKQWRERKEQPGGGARR